MRQTSRRWLSWSSRPSMVAPVFGVPAPSMALRFMAADAVPPVFGRPLVKPVTRKTQVLKPPSGDEPDGGPKFASPAPNAPQRVKPTADPTTDFVLAPPANDTPEAIEAAVCPLCQQRHPLKLLLQHIYTAHPTVDKVYTRRIVRERYTMLKLAQQKYPSTSSATGPKLTSGYSCRHCPAGSPLFASVDAVMKHIDESHPEVDVDDEPLPTMTQAAPMMPPPSASVAELSVAPPAPNMEPLVFSDTSFPCEICRKVFKSETDLIQHLDTAHAEELADPVEEGAASPASATLSSGSLTGATYASATTVSPKVRPIQTPDQKEKLSTYIPTTTGPISVVCDLCTKTKLFTSEVALHSHLVAKHGNEVADPAAKVQELLRREAPVEAQICPHCCKAFPTPQALLGHLTSKHPGALQTADVAMVAVPGTSLSNPELIPGGVWWCNDCNRGFKSGSALTGHLTTKHGLPTQSLPCPACRRMFPDLFALKSHVSQAHKNLDDTIYDTEASYDCQKCPRKFLSSTALKTHEQTFHRS